MDEICVSVCDGAGWGDSGLLVASSARRTETDGKATSRGAAD